MEFWRSALQAAEAAAEAARDLGKKGLEAVEATAEEASRKLGVNLHDKVGAGPGAPEPPSSTELEAYGITPDYAEFVRTLNYSTFRDFPAEHLLPASEPGSEVSSSAAAAGGPPYRLNPWQVRHATLVVQALKEVNELRFVLCPKYMTDEHFWHVYYTMARKCLPDAAYSWAAGAALPCADLAAAAGDSFPSLTDLGAQLKQLGSKLQSAAAAGQQRGLAGLEGLGASLRATSRGPAAGGSSGAAAAAAGAAAAAAGVAGAAAAAAGGGAVGAPASSSLLEDDPDLEAYLQVAMSGATEEGGTGEEDGSGYESVDRFITHSLTQCMWEKTTSIWTLTSTSCPQSGSTANC
ncbi:BSD domain containing [Micractinium conductrix]|uniref:BSD domain containing n=1 Tax=Micractinium conductrix TaxID=554055 RepID=A0A2P6VJH3_9CHLO|nr:BSD domain containing [Micractinium conductrix]|eukprot:PSC74256.1 BSD domain containing [Micractinium conductrix]